MRVVCFCAWLGLLWTGWMSLAVLFAGCVCYVCLVVMFGRGVSQACLMDFIDRGI